MKPIGSETQATEMVVDPSLAATPWSIASQILSWQSGSRVL
jgi:hypothetical protein